MVKAYSDASHATLYCRSKKDSHSRFLGFVSRDFPAFPRLYRELAIELETSVNRRVQLENMPPKRFNVIEAQINNVIAKAT